MGDGGWGMGDGGWGALWEKFRRAVGGAASNTAESGWGHPSVPLLDRRG